MENQENKKRIAIRKESILSLFNNLNTYTVQEFQNKLLYAIASDSIENITYELNEEKTAFRFIITFGEDDVYYTDYQDLFVNAEYITTLTNTINQKLQQVDTEVDTKLQEVDNILNAKQDKIHLYKFKIRANLTAQEISYDINLIINILSIQDVSSIESIDDIFTILNNGGKMISFSGYAYTSTSPDAFLPIIYVNFSNIFSLNVIVLGLTNRREVNIDYTSITSINYEQGYIN